jgi:hypothetical protein
MATWCANKVKAQWKGVQSLIGQSKMTQDGYDISKQKKYGSNVTGMQKEKISNYNQLWNSQF